MINLYLGVVFWYLGLYFEFKGIWFWILRDYREFYSKEENRIGLGI